jgi:hypothetical protein
LRQAGVQLVRDGRIANDVLEKISQPLISEEDFRQRANEAYRKVKENENAESE